MSGIDFLADTNFLIFVAQKNSIVKPFLDYETGISFITEMELLGIFSITKINKSDIQKLIKQCFIIDFYAEIKHKAIEIKQQYKIKLPDAYYSCNRYYFQHTFNYSRCRF